MNNIKFYLSILFNTFLPYKYRRYYYYKYSNDTYTKTTTFFIHNQYLIRKFKVADTELTYDIISIKLLQYHINNPNSEEIPFKYINIKQNRIISDTYKIYRNTCSKRIRIGCFTLTPFIIKHINSFKI